MRPIPCSKLSRHLRKTRSQYSHTLIDDVTGNFLDTFQRNAVRLPTAYITVSPTGEFCVLSISEDSTASFRKKPVNKQRHIRKKRNEPLRFSKARFACSSQSKRSVLRSRDGTGGRAFAAKASNDSPAVEQLTSNPARFDLDQSNINPQISLLVTRGISDLLDNKSDENDDIRLGHLATQMPSPLKFWRDFNYQQTDRMSDSEKQYRLMFRI